MSKIRQSNSCVQYKRREAEAANNPDNIRRAQRAMNREKSRIEAKKKEEAEEIKMERKNEARKKRELDKQAKLENKTLGQLQGMLRSVMWI